jgi:hypothetical protein
MSENTFLAFITSTALAVMAVGCAGATSTGTNGNTASANRVANANPSPAADAAPVISTSEPYKYRATVSLTAQTTGGERVMAIPRLSADVARNGSFGYVSFDLPGGERVTFLNRADMRYVILPDRRQYAELTPETAGFDVPRLIWPGQIVADLQKWRGYERVGEEQLNGRDVVKYAATNTTRTGTQAGDVSAETFIYVDKNTGLPLRTEMLAEATGDVQGVRGVKIITEVRDIQRDYDQSIFEVPQGMNKVTAEQVRRQVNAVVSAANAIAGASMNEATAPSASAPSSPAAR